MDIPKRRMKETRPHCSVALHHCGTHGALHFGAAASISPSVLRKCLTIRPHLFRRLLNEPAPKIFRIIDAHSVQQLRRFYNLIRRQHHPCLLVFVPYILAIKSLRRRIRRQKRNRIQPQLPRRINRLRQFAKIVLLHSTPRRYRHIAAQRPQCRNSLCHAFIRITNPPNSVMRFVRPSSDTITSATSSVTSAALSARSRSVESSVMRIPSPRSSSRSPRRLSCRSASPPDRAIQRVPRFRNDSR